MLPPCLEYVATDGFQLSLFANPLAILLHSTIQNWLHCRLSLFNWSVTNIYKLYMAVTIFCPNLNSVYSTVTVNIVNELIVYMKNNT